jgi:hypothetical protein
MISLPGEPYVRNCRDVVRGTEASYKRYTRKVFEVRDRKLTRIARRIGEGILSVLILLLFLSMLLGPPIAIVLETIDLVRMQERTQGKIDSASIISSRGASRPDIAYHFHAAGRRVDSRRLMPGSFGNHWRWTGGERLARRFTVGAQTTVYYCRSHPELCALEYGWFKWSAALTMLWIGGATFFAANVGLSPGYWQRCVSYAGRGAMAYAFGLLFLGPSVVRVHELHWHFVAWFCAAVAAAVYVSLRRVKTPQDEEQDS